MELWQCAKNAACTTHAKDGAVGGVKLSSTEAAQMLVEVLRLDEAPRTSARCTESFTPTGNQIPKSQHGCGSALI
ncbi:unnamed protein product [Phytophthora fragariaefolia]|uniref:Unnamed protein product n=1 Tax=Phytophthora fragariaefolia TaxID=1490495 RepID=A0A9W7CVU0_9STRA|nr:unnamed protein product [Phytophthora fragariaefolia]